MSNVKCSRRLKMGILIISSLLLVCCSTSKIEAPTTTISSNHVDAFLAQAPLKFVVLDSVKLAVRHYKGEGIPLVFIHGTLDDHHAWAAVAAKLTQKISNPIVLFDLRGHSASLNEAKGAGSILQDAKDVMELTQKLGYEKANFIGHSYGANIAIQLANSYPKIAENIVLYEPPVFNLLFGKPAYKEGLSQSMALISNVLSLLENGEIEQGIQLFIENMAFGKNSWMEALDERTKSTMLSNYPTFLDQARDKERLNIKVAALNNYKGAVLILHGSQSLAHFSACVKEIAILLEKETLVAIEGASHSGVFTHANSIALKIFELLMEEKN